MGKGKKFTRGKKGTSAVSKSLDVTGFDIDAAKESVKDLENLPIEVENVKFLQRQMGKLGNTNIDDKLTAERDARIEYNNGVMHGTGYDSLYEALRIPKGTVLIKLLKKPIFELGGFLIPDLVKQAKSDSSGQDRGFNYVENKFPYLEAGVIVKATTGSGAAFDLEDVEFKGSLVTLKLGTRIDQLVAFIDKSDVSPTYFEGYVAVNLRDLEFVLATPTDTHRNEMFNKLLGYVSHEELSTKVNSELDAK